MTEAEYELVESFRRYTKTSEDAQAETLHRWAHETTQFPDAS